MSDTNGHAGADDSPVPPVISGRPALRARWLEFDGLTPHLVHDILKLRQDVFIVEQDCPFPEIDGVDVIARHFLVEDAETRELAAYMRLLGPTDTAGPRLGRIVIARDWRGCRLGDYLMRAGLAECDRLFPDLPVELSAQSHLEAFYANHGFRVISDVYLEDGIPHLDMRRP